MPQLFAEFSFTHPEVMALISGAKGPGEGNGAGCFIGFGRDMVEALMKSRGWDEVRANRECFRVVGSGAASDVVGF